MVMLSNTLWSYFQSGIRARIRPFFFPSLVRNVGQRHISGGVSCLFILVWTMDSVNHAAVSVEQKD